MPRTCRISPDLLDAALKAAGKAKTAYELRAAQSILLPGLLKIPLYVAAKIIGQSRPTVVRLQAQFRAANVGEEIPRKRWGGRRYAHLTLKEEKNLLAGFFERSAKGGVLVVTEIKAAYEEKVGHKVAKTTIYRMLARHGWRKIAPRRRHPDTSTERQKEFKKKSLRLSRKK